MQAPVRDRFASVRSSAPFALAALLAWVTVPIATSVDWTEYALAAALLVLCGICHELLSDSGIGRIAPELIFLAALGLLRNSGGGIATGASAVAIVPVFYVALHSESRQGVRARPRLHEPRRLTSGGTAAPLPARVVGKTFVQAREVRA